MPVMSHMSSNGSTFYQMFTPSSCALGSSLGFLDGKKDFPQLGPKISSRVISPNSTQYDRPPVFVAAPHQILVPPNKCRQTHPKRYVVVGRLRSFRIFFLIELPGPVPMVPRFFGAMSHWSTGEGIAQKRPRKLVSFTLNLGAKTQQAENPMENP